MRISDWSSDVCSSDLIDIVSCGRWRNAGARLRSDALQPFLHLRIEFAVAAQCVKQGRRIRHQFGQFGIQPVDRKRCVEAERLTRCLWPVTKAIPDFTLQIFVATEQYGLIFFSGDRKSTRMNSSH